LKRLSRSSKPKPKVVKKAKAQEYVTNWNLYASPDKPPRPRKESSKKNHLDSLWHSNILGCKQTLLVKSLSKFVTPLKVSQGSVTSWLFLE
jgi:hypothetical protein